MYKLTQLCFLSHQPLLVKCLTHTYSIWQTIYITHPIFAIILVHSYTWIFFSDRFHLTYSTRPGTTLPLRIELCDTEYTYIKNRYLKRWTISWGHTYALLTPTKILTHLDFTNPHPRYGRIILTHWCVNTKTFNREWLDFRPTDCCVCNGFDTKCRVTFLLVRQEERD